MGFRVYGSNGLGLGGAVGFGWSKGFENLFVIGVLILFYMLFMGWKYTS